MALTKGQKLAAAAVLSAGVAGGTAVTVTQRNCGPDDMARACELCRANPTAPGCNELLASGACEPQPSPSPTIEPSPTPTPSPTPPPQECLPGVPWCNVVGQTCSTPTSQCKHNPTSDPAHCELAPICPTPPPPTPTPTPPPPGGNDCMDEDRMEASSCSGEQFGAEIYKATQALGHLGPDCAENNKKLAAKLRADLGRCVIAGHEAIFILRDDGKAEENHACFYGNGTWTGSGRGKFMGCHSLPLQTECGDPVPNPDPAKWKLTSDLKPQGYVDTTLTTQMQCDYCKSIGMGTINGQVRCGCPVRPEGHPERVACERYVAGGDWIVNSRNGAECKQRANSAQFYPNNGNCQLCNPPKSICSAWY